MLPLLKQQLFLDLCGSHSYSAITYIIDLAKLMLFLITNLFKVIIQDSKAIVDSLGFTFPFISKYYSIMVLVQEFFNYDPNALETL